MATRNAADTSESRARYWQRVLRPVSWWLLLVLVLFGIRTHQRLMENTRLTFTATLAGKMTFPEPTVTFDGKPVFSGQNIPLGHHEFAVIHPKGESYTTNLFIWYGEHDLGAIDLKRTTGNLVVTADPPIDWLVIHGPEWSVTLTNSSGLTNTLPTDVYEIEVEYPHWQNKYQVSIFSGQTTPLNIAPHFGGLQLGCKQSDATYQLQTADGQVVSEGLLPVTVAKLPQGDYKIVAVHHRHQRPETLTVRADTTTTEQIDFSYGTAIFETTPGGAMVVTGDGQNCGVTPLTLNELLPGNWSFTLQRDGYQSVPVSLAVTANETNLVSTNLVSENYLHALDAARQDLAAADYDDALKSAGAALAFRPSDAEATTLQSEAAGLGYIQRAKGFGKIGEYIEGGQELKLALQSLPDNAEAKQLTMDFKQHEPEEIERRRVERMQLPKKSFDAGMAYLDGAALFESHELTTDKSAAETQSAIETQLSSVPPVFKIVRSKTTGEIFVIEATQEFSGGARRCMIVGGQSKDDETQIYFKVVESKKVSFFDQPLGALVGAVPSKYTLIDPAALQSNDKLRNQITEGVSNVTARIQIAIGQTPVVDHTIPPQ